jgi:hypothetical protein
VRCYQDHVDSRIELHDPFQHLEAAQLGHHQVHQDNLRTLAEDRVETLLGVGVGENPQAFAGQRCLDQLEARRRVVYGGEFDDRFHIKF